MSERTPMAALLRTGLLLLTVTLAWMVLASVLPNFHVAGASNRARMVFVGIAMGLLAAILVAQLAMLRSWFGSLEERAPHRKRSIARARLAMLVLIAAGVGAGVSVLWFATTHWMPAVQRALGGSTRMTPWRVLPASARRRMPWKNGRGCTTLELCSDAPASDATASGRGDSASPTCLEAGPFSRFDGVDRWIACVDGPGMRVCVDGRWHQVPTRGAALAFAGEAVAAGEPEAIRRARRQPHGDARRVARGVRGGGRARRGRVVTVPVDAGAAAPTPLQRWCSCTPWTPPLDLGVPENRPSRLAERRDRRPARELPPPGWPAARTHLQRPGRWPRDCNRFDAAPVGGGSSGT
jgi:hypothetical protein